MRRISGIYVLYVKFDSQKTQKSQFGYWRPGVRISTLRPKRNRQPLRLSVSFFVGVNAENFTRALREWSSHSKQCRVSLLTKGARRNLATRQYLHTSTKKKVLKPIDFTGVSALFVFLFSLPDCLKTRFDHISDHNEICFFLYFTYTVTACSLL